MTSARIVLLRFAVFSKLGHPHETSTTSEMQCARRAFLVSRSDSNDATPNKPVPWVRFQPEHRRVESLFQPSAREGTNRMSEVQAPTAQRSHLIGIWNNWFHFIPPKARLAALGGLLALVAFVAYNALSGGPATLNLVCHHDLRSADIQVFMDGKSIYADHIAYGPKRFFGVIGKKASIFSKSLTVPAGDHIVRVHLISAEDRFDQAAEQQLNLPRASENTLLIDAERGGMSIVNKSLIVPESDPGSSYSGLFRSMLVMAFGSAVSAAIGFVVQEFLRSKKSRMTSV